MALFVTPGVRAADDVKLIDFADNHRERDGKVFRPYEYAYEDWGDRHMVDLPGKGALIKAPSGKGGLGENRTAVRFANTPQADLWFVIGNANKAHAINFSLTDRDGTEHQWTLTLTGLPAGQLLRKSIDLTKPDHENKPGKAAGLDLKKISSWQIRGDYAALPTEVLLVRLAGQKR